jgi:hypothetical protein
MRISTPGRIRRPLFSQKQTFQEVQVEGRINKTEMRQEADWGKKWNMVPSNKGQLNHGSYIRSGGLRRGKRHYSRQKTFSCKSQINNSNKIKV